MTPRALLSLLFHGPKALDLVGAALELGLLQRLDEGPVSLGALCEVTAAQPLRMYKFMDGLESLGLVVRDQAGDAIESSTYRSSAPLADAARAVLGPGSIERDRDGYPWREIHAHLPEVLRGELSTRFAWPPDTPAAVAAFEASMAAGCVPAVQAFASHAEIVFGASQEGVQPGGVRWLDVGGGDGSLAAQLLPTRPGLVADVYNLPEVAHLVHARADAARLVGRLGFVAGDFLREPLPSGYDVLSFVRVLHDWPAETARTLLQKAHAALAPGGRLVVSEEFRTPDRLAVQFFWTYFLIGADACVSRLREVGWYTEALVAAGFTDVRIHDGGALGPGASTPFELVTARRA